MCVHVRLCARVGVCVLQPIPQLSVMDPSDAAREKSSGALLPGPCTFCCLTSNNNTIPRMDSQYSKYHYLSVPFSFLQIHLFWKHTRAETKVWCSRCVLPPCSPYSKQHCFLYKRAALPLTEEEERIFTFRKQDQKA